MSESFYIPIGDDSRSAVIRIANRLSALSRACPWVVMVTEKKHTRSLAQNAMLWAIYDDILRVGGEKMGGWENKDLHEFFLGEHYGWEKLGGMKRDRLKPLRRSSRMSKTEFSAHVEYIVRYMASEGIFIGLPGDAEMAA